MRFGGAGYWVRSLDGPRNDLRQLELGNDIATDKSYLLIGEPISGDSIGVIALPDAAHGLESSITLLADCAVLVVGRNVHRLDWADFRQRWIVRYESPVYSVLVCSDRLIVVYETGVSALSLDTGKRLWTVPCDIVVSTRIAEGAWIRVEDESGAVREINSENGKTRRAPASR